MKWQQSEFTITDEREKLDVDLIHNFLSDSYWSKGIPKEVVAKSLAHSLCFGLFHRDRQIGFGRVITDRATFAYLADVFVIENYRDRGLGKWLVACILEHPEVRGLRRWMLATLDAHQLYLPIWFCAIEQAGAVHGNARSQYLSAQYVGELTGSQSK